MKKVFLGLIIFCSSISSKGQYIPINFNNATFHYIGSMGGSWNCQLDTYYQYTGDTSIGGYTYSHLISLNMGNCTTPTIEPMFLMRNDSLNKRVYCYFQNSDLVYCDFSMQIGDTMNNYFTYHTTYTLNEIDSVLIGSNWHRKLKFQNGSFFRVYLEGIGLIDEYHFEGGQSLVCFSKDSVPVYQYQQGNCLVPSSVSNVDGFSGQDQISISNNHLRMDSFIGSLQIYNLTGQRIYSYFITNNSEIDLNYLQSGVYIILATNEKGSLRFKFEL